MILVWKGRWKAVSGGLLYFRRKMEGNMNTKKIVTTAVLLALCIVFQSMKGISVYLTGTAVNTFLIMAALLVGTGSSVFLAVITPLVAYLMGATPIMQMIPLMVPTVMEGDGRAGRRGPARPALSETNIAIIAETAASAGRKKQLPFWLAAGAVLKAVVLWLLVWYVMLPFFGAGVPEPMQLVVKTTFSVTQFITAAVGGVIAYIVYGRVRNAVNR